MTTIRLLANMANGALILLLAASTGALAQTSDPLPPGQLIDLGGRRIHLNCAGTGSPAVIVENGGGGVSVEWALVQPEIAKHTRICTYDRAGYAWSDRGPVDDGIEQTMDDLNLLFRKASIRPPYIFVGASLGCLYARAYQRRFPEQVAGLVFVDGTHDGDIVFPVDGKRKPINQMSREELPAAYSEYMRVAPHPKAGPADQPPLDRLPPDLRKARQWAFEKAISEMGLLPHTLVAAESWREELTALRRQRETEAHPLGNLSLIVLDRTEGADETHHAQEAQLAALSSAGKLVKAEGSGHMIHLYRPDLVIQAIQEVMAGARER